MLESNKSWLAEGKTVYGSVAYVYLGGHFYIRVRKGKNNLTCMSRPENARRFQTIMSEKGKPVISEEGLLSWLENRPVTPVTEDEAKNYFSVKRTSKVVGGKG